MGEIAINPIHNVHKKYRTMNLVNPYIFAPPVDLSTNTEIGGVAATISTPALLATKLGIDVSRITNFTIVGSDIKCKITGGSYGIHNTAFEDDTNITYYDDPDGLVTSIGYRTFRGVNIIGSSKLVRLTFKNATLLDTQSLQYRNNCAIYIPNALTFNTDPLAGTSQSVIYCNSYLATNNGGGIDASIASAISSGAIVRFITNYTAPNPVTTLAAGTIFSTAIKLNFTPPSSTNTIDYYECYANDVLQNKINGSGDYITGLTASTSYILTIYAIDIFRNKSLVSNAVIQNTNTTNAQPTTGLISYYKLDETTGTTANDSFGTEHLTNTSVTINQSGKKGNSYLTTANSQKLSSSTFTVIPTNFTFNAWVKRTSNTGAYGTLIDYGNYGTGWGMWHDVGNNLSWRINSEYTHFSSLMNLPLNIWTMVTMVYNGTNVKMYNNGVLKTTDAWTTNPTTPTTKNLFLRPGTSQTFIGSLDEVSIYNSALTQSEIQLIYNNGIGITI